MKKWELTAESFDCFLEWLDSDHEQAAQKYEAIRRRLIVFFDCRCCNGSEDLADQTINRVIRQAPGLVDKYSGDPIPYFYKVAHYVHLDFLRDQAKRAGGPLPETIPDMAQPGDDDEKILREKCLDRCLQEFSPKERDLILEYYREDRRAKIDHRKWLADQYECTVNALRIRVHRLMDQLRECVKECVQNGAAG